MQDRIWIWPAVVAMTLCVCGVAAALPGGGPQAQAGGVWDSTRKPIDGWGNREASPTAPSKATPAPAPQAQPHTAAAAVPAAHGQPPSPGHGQPKPAAKTARRSVSAPAGAAAGPAGRTGVILVWPDDGVGRAGSAKVPKPRPGVMLTWKVAGPPQG